MQALKKTPSGIKGLDELTGGGLPAGRPTLIRGGPARGKTMLAPTFLVKEALDYGEPGVFVSFDERIPDLSANVASLGFDLSGLSQRGSIAMDHVKLNRQSTIEVGDYDLEGLFVRFGHAIGRIGAKRVVLDSIDSLFAGIPNTAIVRSELGRLFTWLKDRELSAIITAEHGEKRPYASRRRRICFRLCDRAGSPRRRTVVNAPIACGEVSRCSPRHERISIFD